MATRYFDFALYALASIVICVIVGGAVCAERVARQESETHAESVRSPIILTATEAADQQLESANNCLRENCEQKQIENAKKLGRSARVYRGIFFRWRRR